MKQIRSAMQNKSGAALVVAMCVMALTMVLSLSLLLGASMMMKSAEKQINRQQAWALTQSLSDRVDKNVTQHGSDMQTEIRTMVLSKTDPWPSYAPAQEGHSLTQATRTYYLAIPDEMQDTLENSTIAMYWVQNEGSTRTLFVITSCSYHGETASMTQSYTCSDDGMLWQNTGFGTNIEGGAGNALS